MKILQLLNFILSTLIFCQANIFRPTNRLNNPEVLGRVMISYTPNQNHVVAISKANSTQIYGDQFHFIYINYNSQNYTVQTLNLPFKAISARTNHQNNNDLIISNRKFLILTSNQSVIAVYNSTIFWKNVTSNNTIILDYCLETNREEFYTLQTTNISGTPYQLGYYSMVYNWSRKVNLTQNFQLGDKIMMKCMRSSIFLNFTDKIRVYTLNQSLWNIKTIRDHGNLSYMHAFGQMLTTRNDTQILLFNTSANYSLVRTVVMDPLYTYFYSLYFGNNTYLYISRKPIGSNITLISQYDLRTNKTIFQLNSSIQGTAMEMVHNHIFQFHDANIIPLARPWYVDVFYSNTSCISGYVRQSFTNYLGQVSTGCVQTSINLQNSGGYTSNSSLGATPFIYMLYEDKNIYNDLNNYDGCNPGNISSNISSNTSNNTTTNITNNTTNNNISNNSSTNITNNTTTNTTNNTTNNTTTNISTNISANQSNNMSLDNSQNSSYNYMDKYNSSILDFACSVFSKGIAVTQSTRSVSQVLQSLALLIDDFQLYKYHQTTYPFSFLFFIQKAQIMNNIQIQQNLTKGIQIGQEQNLQYTSLISINQKKVDQIYFLKSGRESYFEGSLTTLVIFLFFKFIHFILYLSHTKFKFLLEFYKHFNENTRWWTLITALFQSNMSSVMFECSLQFNIPSFLYLGNKFNLILTFAFTFLLLIYCIVFYPLVFRFEQKKYSKSLLTRTNQMKTSYFLQTSIFVSKCFIRGFINGFFINSYEILIFALAFSDLAYLILVLKYKKYFTDKFISFFTIVYFSGLTILDFFYAIQKVNSQIIADLNRQSLTLILILVMLAALLGHILYIIYFMIFSTIKSLCQCLSMKKIKQNIQQINPVALIKKNRVAPVNLRCQIDDNLCKTNPIIYKLKYHQQKPKIKQKNNESQIGKKFKKYNSIQKDSILQPALEVKKVGIKWKENGF